MARRSGIPALADAFYVIGWLRVHGVASPSDMRVEFWAFHELHQLGWRIDYDGWNRFLDSYENRGMAL
jgi:hypothetical protein